VPGPASSPAAGAGAPSGAASASASRAAAEAALERAIDAATAGDEDEDEAEDEVYDPEGPEERAIASAAQRRAPEPAREDELGCDAPAGDPPGVSISRPGATAPGASAAAVPTASPLLALIPAAKVDRHVVRPGDTLTALARAHKVTIGLVRRLNGIQGDRIRVGATLAIPRGPFSAAVERASFSLAIDLDGSPVKKYAVGVGRDGSTPAGEFEVRTRVENPDWTSPEGDYFRSGDAANPLGTRWLGFGADGYGIHGTTDPSSIGREASRGCVRLNPGDVEEVYDFLTIGSRVTIR
jgi:lipoprotein-anchoring transpeptidase ErfK/SrfK